MFYNILPEAIRFPQLVENEDGSTQHYWLLKTQKQQCENHEIVSIHDQVSVLF